VIWNEMWGVRGRASWRGVRRIVVVRLKVWRGGACLMGRVRGWGRPGWICDKGERGIFLNHCGNLVIVEHRELHA
jgi:hypothetical protein